MGDGLLSLLALKEHHGCHIYYIDGSTMCLGGFLYVYIYICALYYSVVVGNTVGVDLCITLLHCVVRNKLGHAWLDFSVRILCAMSAAFLRLGGSLYQTSVLSLCTCGWISVISSVH